LPDRDTIEQGRQQLFLINKTNNMNIVTFLESEETKVIAWVKAKEPEFVSAIQQAYAFTKSALAWAKSPQGVAVEAFIEANLPKSTLLIGEGVTIVTEIVTDLSKVTSVAAMEGIALRLGAEILQLLDGKKLPTGISGYLAEFQTIFVG
jgi:hypothetical protein